MLEPINVQYAKCNDLFINVENRIITQGRLRAEVQLTTQTVINFNFLQSNNNTNTQISTQTLLKQGDAFFITAWGFALKKVAADAPTANEHATAILYYYNNPAVFSGGNAVNVGALYNSNFAISIDNIIYNTTFPMTLFQRVPELQQGQVTAAIAGPTTYTAARDGFPAPQNGFFPNYPYIAFNGTQNIIPQIILPPQTNLSFDDAGNSYWAVLMVDGFYVANGANLELNTSNRFTR